jgi:hypothetical protein
MTEPVEGISRAKEVAEKNKRDPGRLQREKHSGHQEAADDDSIDISDEARERAAGKRRRNIMEYINEEPV